MAALTQLHFDFGDEARALFTKFYPLLVQNAWQDAADTLGVDLAFDLDNPFVQEVLDQLAQQITGISDTTQQEVQALIGRQAAEGWSIDDLADQIAALAETSAKSRAQTIARTETAAAYSKGSLLAYHESGVVSSVEWLATDPCDICAPLDGATVPLGSSFDGGVDHPPAHPNCRCALAPVVG